MKGTLLLADAIAGHPDHTFSLVRGGITQCHAPENQIDFEGAMLGRLLTTPGDAGSHEFSLKFLDLDGKLIGKDVADKFTVRPEGGIVQFVFKLKIKIPKYGKYVFVFSVDRNEIDTWPLEASPVPNVST